MLPWFEGIFLNFVFFGNEKYNGFYTISFGWFLRFMLYRDISFSCSIGSQPKEIYLYKLDGGQPQLIAFIPWIYVASTLQVLPLTQTSPESWLCHQILVAATAATAA